MTRASAGTRRWPDLLIGLLVLLLLGGFASLLLGQRPQPLAQAPAQTTPPATDSTPEASSDPITIPSAPGTDGTPGTGEATTASEETQAQEATPPAQESDAADSAQTSPNTADTPTDGAGDLAEVPAEPIETSPTAPATTTPPTPAPEAVTVESIPATPATPSAAPRAGGAVAPSEARTPLRSDYRVSLGSFATRRTAERLTEGVRELGYTVYPIDVGSGVVAQVGPFADEASARQALADIQRAYPGAVIYPPRGRNLRGGGVSEAPAPAAPDTSTSQAASPPTAPSTPAEAPEPTPAASTAPEAGPEAVPAPSTTASTSTAPSPSAPSTPAPAAPTASGPVYLQVGAFDRVESAQRLVTELRGQGYVPTVNAPEGGKVTVLVGPYSGSALESAETRLSAGGLDHFRVR